MYMANEALLHAKEKQKETEDKSRETLYSLSAFECGKRAMYLANACHMYTHVIRLQETNEGKYNIK